MKRIIKKALSNKHIFFLSVAIFALSTVCLVAVAEINQVPELLKLKAPKEKILSEKVIDDVRCDGDGNCTSVGKAIQYLYVSDSIVPFAEWKGLREDISKRGKNVQKFLKNKSILSEEWVAKFYVSEPFYKVGNNWYQTEYATTTIDAYETQTLSTVQRLFVPSVFAYQATTTAGAGDGTIWGEDSSGDFYAARNKSVGDSVQSTSNQDAGAGIYHPNSSSYSVRRNFFPFVTGQDLPDNTVITLANFAFVPYAVNNTINNPSDIDYNTVVRTDQLDTTTLTTDDFNNCGATTTPLEGIDPSNRIDIGSMSAGTYSIFPLSSIGISWISRTGTTTLGVRIGYDTSSTTPGTTGYDSPSIQFSETAGTGGDPYLEVIYTIPPSPYQDKKVRKSTDESYSFSSPFNYDSELGLNLASTSKTYIIDGAVHVTSASNVPDIKIAFELSPSTGVTMDIGHITSNGEGELLEISNATSSAISISANKITVIHIFGTVKTTTDATTLKLKWAQNSSNANPVTVKEGSYLSAQEL